MQFEVGSIVEGKITGITKFGAFVELAEHVSGMIHISEVSNTFVNDISEFFQVGQNVKALVVSTENGKISLSIKKLQQKEKVSQKRDNEVYKKPEQQPLSFEEMMAKFKQSSEEKISDLKKNTEFKRGGYSYRRGK